jgi:hypothetical protein
MQSAMLTFLKQHSAMIDRKIFYKLPQTKETAKSQRWCASVKSSQVIILVNVELVSDISDTVYLSVIRDYEQVLCLLTAFILRYDA